MKLCTNRCITAHIKLRHNLLHKDNKNKKSPRKASVTEMCITTKSGVCANESTNN